MVFDRTNHRPDRSSGMQRAALAVAVTSVLASATATAANFEVTSSADSGAGSLRDAIAEANATPGADTLSFGGVSNITLTSGQIEITEDLSINGPVGGVAISGNDSSRIFGVTEQGARLALDRVVLTQGRAEDTGGSELCGAGTRNGGAICSLGPLTLRDSRLLDNEAVDGRGGAVYMAGAGLVLLEDCELSGNQSFDQGGAASIGSDSLMMRNCIVSNNTSVDTSSYGGGMYVSAETVIESTTFAGNTTLAQNGDGGALWLRDSAEITNSTFSGNMTTGPGAEAAAIFSADGNLTLRSVTVVDNTSARGGAISFRDNDPRTFDLISSVLADNPGPEGNLRSFAEDDGPITVNVEASLFGDPANEIDGISVANVFSDDPQLNALADNGCEQTAGIDGPGILPPARCVPTHAPQPGSPVIDAGDNLFDPTDQRGDGFPRFVFNGVDIGAIEFDGVPSGPPIPEAVPVPTLSNRMLLLFSGVLGLLGLIATRRHGVPER
jgi:hypothetical protein